MHGSNESLNSLVAEQQGMDHVNYLNGSPEVDPTQFWQGILDEQCGLNCDIAKESIAFDNMKQDTDVTAKSAVLGCDNGAKEFGHGATLPHGYYGTDDGMLSDLTVPAAWEEIGQFSFHCRISGDTLVFSLVVSSLDRKDRGRKLANRFLRKKNLASIRTC